MAADQRGNIRTDQVSVCGRNKECVASQRLLGICALACFLLMDRLACWARWTIGLCSPLSYKTRLVAWRSVSLREAAGITRSIHIPHAHAQIQNTYTRFSSYPPHAPHGHDSTIHSHQAAKPLGTARRARIPPFRARARSTKNSRRVKNVRPLHTSMNNNSCLAHCPVLFPVCRAYSQPI